MIIDGSIAAVVTGGASGLGEAVVRMLAGAGASVGLFDRDRARGEALAGELGCLFVEVDVSSAESVQAGFAAVRARHGQERVLVNCAGIAPPAKTVSRGLPHDPDLFRRVVEVNLVGTFVCASQAAAGMSAADPVTADGERGVIVNTASVAAFEGQVGQVAYSASKAAIAGMTLPMARDLAKSGVRVTTVAPGIFSTPMLQGLDEEVRESLAAQIPFPSRLGQPAEYAALVRHIVENPMLNGETIRLDGAIRMGMR